MRRSSTRIQAFTLLLLTGCATTLYAQGGAVGDIFDRLKRKAPDVSSLLKGSPPITTSLSDATFGDPSLDGFTPRERERPLTESQRTPGGGFLLGPGYYTAQVQSYCLHAGTHGPGGGGGYLYAPPKGKAEEAVVSIVRNSVAHPGIAQHDIQMLIWAVLARAKFENLEPRLRATAARLLTPKQLATLNRSALDLLPGKELDRALGRLSGLARRVTEAEARLRDLLTTPGVTYREIEQVAVPGGAAPWEEGGRVVPPGRWSRHPAGYFVRYLPGGYSSTQVEIWVPEGRAAVGGGAKVGLALTLKQGQSRVLTGGAQVDVDLARHVAVPGNAGSQRLLLSGRVDINVSGRPRGRRNETRPPTGRVNPPPLPPPVNRGGTTAGPRTANTNPTPRRNDQPANRTSNTGRPLPPYITPEQYRNLMGWAAQMDRIADNAQKNALAASSSFFRRASSNVSKTLKFLAQPYDPQKPLGHPAHAMLDYLLNDYNENDRKLYEGAVEAMDLLEKDPAAFWADHALDVLPPQTRVATRAAEVTKATGAAQRIVQMEEKAQKFAGAVSKFDPGPPPLSRPPARGVPPTGGSPRPGTGGPGRGPGYGMPGSQPNYPGMPPLNPQLGSTNCFPVALAQDLRWRTGKLEPIPPTRLMSADEIIKVLREFYGKAKPKDPLHGPAGMTPGTRMMATRQGIPVTSSQQLIEQSLPKGGQGLVFIKRADGTNHVFNVRNHNGRVEFWDSQVDMPASFQNVTETYFYRTN